MPTRSRENHALVQTSLSVSLQALIQAGHSGLEASLLSSTNSICVHTSALSISAFTCWRFFSSSSLLACAFLIASELHTSADSVSLFRNCSRAQAVSHVCQRTRVPQARSTISWRRTVSLAIASHTFFSSQTVFCLSTGSSSNIERAPKLTAFATLGSAASAALRASSQGSALTANVGAKTSANAMTSAFSGQTVDDR